MRQRNWAIGLILAGILASCATEEPPSGYRDPTRTIASAALFDAARFAGPWHVAAAYEAEAACGALSQAWAPTAAPGVFAVGGTVCTPDGLRGLNRRAEVVGPGRILWSGPNGEEVLWVLWVDADYRVAVIGTPSGSFGRILSRDIPVRPDLMASAKQIMAFNGYDISRLKQLP